MTDVYMNLIGITDHGEGLFRCPKCRREKRYRAGICLCSKCTWGEASESVEALEALLDKARGEP